MGKLEERFYQDRQLRDAAKSVLLDDIDHARTSFSAKGVADRIGTRIGDGAVDVFETARDKTDDNRGIIAALIGAILLWLGRQPILEALGLVEPSDEDPTALEADTLTEENAAPADPAPDAVAAPSGDDDEQ